jgi:hypothetical protein
MLQGVEAQVGQFLGLWVSEDRHHAALVVKFVGYQHFALSL